ncbi:hypothetical protein J5N97_019783 [Dioscorea zingiberensis]|uniref:Dof-type domain-containing protein n=1 Tax=Dioscorea zingiberensis TaxID=325984 RepID=A0A9D5HCT5_9LILI|nr:hypothetical protein J5N97_019783 [Dioscorea zingiberensis]
MADLAITCNAPGFKLFGKTIRVVEEKQSYEESSKESTLKDIETKVEDSAVRLQCPRCESKETKFCYFNNYNVNQPRHFCRSCHRYWTAGGSLRNIPKGAGRKRSSLVASYSTPFLKKMATRRHWLLQGSVMEKRSCSGL